MAVIAAVITNCSSSTPVATPALPAGLIFTDSIPKTGWGNIPPPSRAQLYYIYQTPVCLSQQAARDSILAAGQLFLLDTLTRFYHLVQRDTVKYAFLADLPLDSAWLKTEVAHPPFTGSLSTCHYKKGKAYVNHTVRRRWLALGKVEWPDNLMNTLLEERIKLAIRNSTNPSQRQFLQLAIRDVITAPIKPTLPNQPEPNTTEP